MARSKGSTGHKMVKVDKTKFIPKISPPENLTDEAKEIWFQLVEAVPNDNLIPSDAPVLEIYCNALITFRRAVDRINAEGEVIYPEGGKQFKNPWVDVMNSANSKIANTASKLRLNPASRMDKTIVKGQQAKSTPTTELGKLING